MIHMSILTDALCAAFVCCKEILHLYKNSMVKTKKISRRLKQILGLSPFDTGTTLPFWTLKENFKAVV